VVNAANTPRSNYLILTEAMDILRAALAPFVERELKRHSDGWWRELVLPNVSPHTKERLLAQASRGQRNNLAPLDLADLLQLILRVWTSVFGARLSPAARAYAQELYEVRNLWAHKGEGDLPRASVDRAIDTAALLLEGIDRAAAERLRLLREGGVTAASPLPASPPPAPASAAEPLQLSYRGGLPPWRNGATPRADVRSGTFTQSQFAADLAPVARGDANVASEYRDPIEFFSRTYVTAGIRTFLKAALLRLAGQGGDPVVQLKTGFGGGKTHTMLALYHLAKAGPRLVDHPALRELFAEVGAPPSEAHVAVLVGTAIDPTTPFTDDRQLRELGIELRTLWGRMAWELAGLEGYRLVAEADHAGVAPGGETLQKLFALAAPSIVLIDELVAFARNLPSGATRIAAGSFEANLTFIQNLTEAARNSPRTLVVASIPESDMEVGGTAGHEVLRRIEMTFGRLETPWTPVETLEAFEVVRRRLFERVDPSICDAVARAFTSHYRDNANEFPLEAGELAYEDRIRRAYPFHPELFDRLYEDWNAAIPHFQSTRGVLRLLAAVVYYLWQKGDAAPLIMPGTLPLEAPGVRDEVMRYLDRGFQPVIESDIDGPQAQATEIDNHNPRFGRLQAARAMARAIFLGSVPGKAMRGIEDGRARLGATLPGESVSTYNDALSRLLQQLQYLYSSEGKRYWFDVRPNLTRTASDRMSRYSVTDVKAELEALLRAERSTGGFTGKHIAPENSAAVPDDAAARLVIVPPDQTYNSSDGEQSDAMRWARDVLDHRGNAPRLHRNMLVFVALDQERLNGLLEQGRRYLAWRSIVEDQVLLNLDAAQVAQATKNRDEAHNRLKADLPIAYRWVLLPAQEVVQREDQRWTGGDEQWQTLDLDRGGLFASGDLAQRVTQALETEERLLTKCTPFYLARELERWFWSQGWEDLSLRKLWDEYLTRYLYFPRLCTREVLARAVVEGASSREFFGYAQGRDASGRYVGLCFGQRPASPTFNAEELIVRRDVALRQLEEEDAQKRSASPSGTPRGGGSGTTSASPSPPSPPVPLPRRFHGGLVVSGEGLLRIASKVGQLNAEVVQHLAELPGARASIRLEVEVEAPEGVPEEVQRIVAENARTLGLQPFAFEDE